MVMLVREFIYAMALRELTPQDGRPELQVGYQNFCFIPTVLLSRGRVDDLSFFEYLSPFCFLLIEFHCTFFISYKILSYFLYYYCILVRM